MGEEEGDLNEFEDSVEFGTLTVPVGAGDAYRQAPEWKRFPNIVESATVSVDELSAKRVRVLVEGNQLKVVADQAMKIRVFDMSGQTVAQANASEASFQLPLGVYVVKAGKYIQKVYID